ncbi:MAG: SusC/RagA family TonB-linked outer membrane protein [Bacteroidales bacterium]|nr:SusC/RagA family TonB-linked outer membrane protein [Bacteroidales bacterium]
MKKVLSFLLLMALGILTLLGQAREVTGTVVSADDGGPLPGVTVAVKGTSIGAISDMNGEYQLTVPDNAEIIVFSFVGLLKQEITISGQNQVDVTMESDLMHIDEVVVTAMGIRKEKKALGYSVQELNESQISGAKNMDVSKSLQGKIAGVTVKQSSGMPGATSHVTIRGNVSLTGSNQPLYVVDGMPIASNKAFTENVGEGTNPSSRIVDLNPEDIESISVLKGATASALYGLRAANGVIVITTKSGSAARMAGKKTLVTVNSSFTSDQISRLPELQSTYGQGNGGLLNLWSSGSWGPRIDTLQNYQSQEENLYFDNPYETFDGSAPTQVPRVYNNQEDFFQKGYTFTNSVDISSASDRASYSIGAGRTNQKGIIETTGMTRNNAKFNGNFILGDKWSASVSANVSTVDIDKIPGGSNLANPLFTVYFAPRTYDMTNKPFEHDSNPYNQYHYRFAMDNPYWALKHSNYNEVTDRFFGNAAINFQPFDWMRINYRVGLDRFLTTGHEVISLGSGGAGRGYPEFGILEPAGGQVDDYTYQRQELNSNASISIIKDFGDIGLDMVIGNEFYDITTKTHSMTGTNITIGGFDHISNTGAQTVFQELTRQRVVGFYGSATVDYVSMLFLTVTGRNDVVSNMPSGNRSYFYPSVSLGFVFTELDFMQDQQILPFGKIRASYSQMGQAGALFATKTLFTSKEDSESLGSGFLNNDFTFPYQSYPAFTLQSTLLSDQLRPQNVTTYEIGADLRFYQNRLGIDYSYYYVNATDQIFNVPLASSSGFRSEYRNAGELESKGHEVVLSVVPIRTGGGFEWEMLVNFANNKNMVLELAPGVERVQTGFQNFTSTGAFAYAGQPYPVIFGSSYVRDENDRIVVDSREIVAGNPNPFYGMPLQDGEEKILGKVNPDWDASLTNILRFKGFTFTAQFNYSKGGFISSGLNALLRNYGADQVTEDRETLRMEPNAVKGYRDQATGDLIIEGDNDIEILMGEDYWSTVQWNIGESRIFDKTLLRLREVVISYDMPQRWFTSSFISSISVFANGRNLALWTDYPNFDPESSTAEGNGIGAFEYVSLPNTRSFGGGLKITF